MSTTRPKEEEPWEVLWEAEWDDLGLGDWEPDGDELADARPQSAPEPNEPVGRARAARLRLAGRWARWAALVVLAAMVGTLAAVLWPQVSGPSNENRGRVTQPGEHIVAWTVRSERPDGPTFVAVLAAGGQKPPLALAVPAETVTSVPGHDVISVAEAAAAGDSVLMGTVVENLVGVHVQDSLVTPVDDVGGIVEAVGPIPVDGREMGPRAVVRYLHRAPVGLPEGLFRWEVVLAELLPAARPSDVEALPRALRDVFRASWGEPVEVIGLPVRDAGAGVVVPDQEAVQDLVGERFGGEAGPARRVRLVLLNGNGIPGIGAQVADILVPEGFRVVESGNARSFDMPHTLIIASSEGDLPYARKAHLLLGTGKLLLGEHPTGLGDVTIVIGEDFGGA
ncbi:MAG TPA: LytR C-terminal domain-containing protein [Actinomycetota bacterium]|nr:LytR C-terminal domain-containing protein [Actinomycetota bacterium]